MARFERGVRPIGFWSTQTRRFSRSMPATMRPPVGPVTGRSRSMGSAIPLASASAGFCPSDATTRSSSAWLTRLDLPEPDTPVTAVMTPSGNAASRARRLLRVTPSRRSQPRGVRGVRRVGLRRRQIAAGDRARDVAQAIRRTAVEHLAAARSGARTDVDDPVGVAHDVQLVLDHEQRVAGGAETIEGPQQRLGVGRMQAGRRLVEHVDHAEQVGADLRRQAQPLQFARRQRRRAALEGEVAEAEIEQHLESGDEVFADALRHHFLLGMVARQRRERRRRRRAAYGRSRSSSAASVRRDIPAMSSPAKVTASASGRRRLPPQAGQSAPIR